MNSLEELQMIEQNAQQYLLQRQQYQSQLMEIESALTELGKSKNAYRIVGNIMVSAKKDDLEKDLKEKREMFELRIRSLENQEAKLKEKAKELQKKVLEGMENAESADKKSS